VNAEEKLIQTLRFIDLLYRVEKSAEDNPDISEILEVAISTRLRYKQFLERIDFQ
jgi:hypothetical protein